MDKSARIQSGSERRSAEEGRQLAQRWRASGLIASEFCRRNQVPVHVLRYWAGRKSGGQAKLERSTDFFEMTAGPRVAATNAPEVAGEHEAGAHDVSRAVVIVVPLRPGATSLANVLEVVLREATS
jgi:hypothetical protein